MIPKSIDEVTDQWLGDVLAAKVVAQTRTQVGQGVGLMGDIFRVDLEYAAEGPDQPSSVVVKLPSSFEENREQGVSLGMFEAEVRFYNELAPKNAAGLPHVFHAEIASGSADFVIVMEDLSSLTMVNQSDGMNVEQALDVVTVLANLHALWWDKVQDSNLEWIPSMIGPRIDFVDQYLTSIFPAFVDNFADRLPAGGLAIYEKFVGNYAKINRLIAQRSPWTLAHQDFRVENLMFGAPGTGKVVVIDWQGIGRGPGAYDLAYVLGGSMEPQIRRQHEDALLSTYHQQLQKRDITDYTAEQLQEDYSHCHLMGGLATSLLTGGAMDLGNERGTELIATMARRHAIAAMDHNGINRLESIG